MDLDYKVSIIIPVYKVSEYVGRCADSLFGQTLQNIEYIFVNDASPDNSIEVVLACLEHYPKRKTHVKIVSHDKNRGLAAARNSGLALATGEYIYHCDSDDFLELTMLEEMYLVAKKKDADIVYSDFYLSFAMNERYMSNPNYEVADEMFRIGLLCGTMKYNVWNKIVKRSLYIDNNIFFPIGHNMGEDMTMICLSACAKSVAFVPKAFYHYVKQNINAYSNTMSEQHKLDIRFNVEKTVAFLEDMFGNVLSKEISFFKLNTKLPFIITDDPELHNLWKEWWPETNNLVLENKYQSLRIRLLQWLASKGQFWAVKLHYRIIYKFIYGIVFK